ncbi:class I SAM-dependent methyltransferase [Microbacterium sp. M28]|uniref:class I SAM-dependent DNA methyltransferase n=1 Tax=Microbacterium sp. M28 TaxID=2962064 RepID=UPI0021F4E7FE|nr:class I SAM-dependent methyltransferase [Microbacterium sp. M28]UYO98412.1 class I SAM-dependent methyltransferase [Microbacterium sp. M28]
MSDDAARDDAVPSDKWTKAHADRYDVEGDPMFDPELLAVTTAFLAERAGDGRALEFAIGTGRVAIPLQARGVDVTGIEYAEPMAERLREKSSTIPVVIGDMATTKVEGEFSLVYLVFNTIENLYTQDAQVECFRNAARHLVPGGRFVVEVEVPAVRRMPPGNDAAVFDVTAEHVGLDTYDFVTQRATSHHYVRQDDGRYEYGPHHFRYVWPSELDLMARIAGLRLESRHADWIGSPFTSESDSHVSVWRKDAGD